MSDKNDLNYIINKLDNISVHFNKIINDFESELAKMKSFSDYSKKKKFIPYKFYSNFLKPHLKEKRKLTKDKMFSLCQQRKKYNSYNTLNSYLHILETNGYIQSERVKNRKYYFLTKEES